MDALEKNIKIWTAVMEDTYYLDNDLKTWLIFLTSCIATPLIVWSVKKSLSLLSKRFHKQNLAATQGMLIFFDALNSALNISVVSFALIGFETSLLDLSIKAEIAIRKVTVIAIFLELGLMVWNVSNILFDYYYRRADPQDAVNLRASYAIVKFLTRIILYSLLILSALDNLGFEIKTLITGLGIGGVAIALAVQNVFGDILSSLAIVLDKPFEPEDFIVVDDVSGNVERIGIKTTRIRSLSGEQVIISNSEILKKKIFNYKRMTQRRVAIVFKVPLDIEESSIVAINSGIKEVISSTQLTLFGRCHLSRVADCAYEFELIYFVLSSDYTAFMDTKQQVYFGIRKILGDLKTNFASPRNEVIILSPKV